ncbi:MAG: hypothetical protein LBN05_03335 [Oscillospiraceae bacterium]|nr:hypothetical protein [Oscillospiraceae bacterium]
MKLYLETTMFNYYFDTERDGHTDTVRLFEEIRAGKHEAYTSGYTIEELLNAPESKRSKMMALIDEFGVTTLDITETSNALASLYVAEGFIPARFRMDGAHIAIASIHGLDCVLSYNFTHINRVKTKTQAERVNHENGYKTAIICTAKEVLEDEQQLED